MSRDQWTSSQGSRPWERVALPHNGYRPGVRDGVCVGAIVVLDREPWRVLEITERSEDLWPPQYETEWQKRVAEWDDHESLRIAGKPYSWGKPREPRPEPVRAEWSDRPIVIVLQHVDRPESTPRHGLSCVSTDWQTLPEHYSVCRLCHELPPCRHEETEKTVTVEVDRAERLMAIPRGACLGCGETITLRMKATRFPGPNLWRPDWGTDSAVFHARQQAECSNGVWRYETQWKEQGLDVLNPVLPEAAEGER